MFLHPEIPLTQHLKRRQMLDVVRVEVLELKAVGPQDGADEPSARHRKSTLVEGDERDHIPW
jgi:hypothetical protein